MNKVVINALNSLKNDIASNKHNKNRAIEYLSYSNLASTFTHDEIYAINRDFVNKAKDFLGKNYPNRFCIWSEDRTVYISTYDFLNTYIDRADRFLVRGNG